MSLNENMNQYNINITVEVKEGKSLRNLIDELIRFKLKSGVIITATAAHTEMKKVPSKITNESLPPTASDAKAV